MDSRLLNIYHDEPYDVISYDHFESSLQWPADDNIGIGSMELSDTLDGILPIGATENDHNICNIIFDDIVDAKDFYENKELISIQNDDNALVYKSSEEERVGIINDDNVVFGNNKNQNIEDDDERSEISFRTRTDSSSIGDYESHTSDYDDDDDDYDDDDDGDGKAEDSLFDIQKLEKEHLSSMDLTDLRLLNNDDKDIIFNGIHKTAKQRTISTNTIGSDVLDANNFDLADFITNDDVPEVVNNNNHTQAIIKPIVQIISSKIDENDSDSDVIVDVETVESEEAKERALLLKNATIQIQMHEDNMTYVDNVKEDPEWSPKKELKSKQTLNNKKQNDSTKNIKCPTTHQAKGANNNRNKVAATKNLHILKSTSSNVPPQAYGVGKGGKKLSLLKRDCKSIEDEKDSQARVKEKDIAPEINQNNYRSIDPRTSQNRETAINAPNCVIQKRKLNLEEYKRRHGEDFSNISSSKDNIVECAIKTTAAAAAAAAAAATTTTTVNSLPQTPQKKIKQHSEAVTSIVKTLKEEQQQAATSSNMMDRQKIDPITLAKNKVLRMQELKKVQQMKIIDSAISAKVPRVTKLLPLQEIIKDTAYAIKNHQESTKQPTNPDYVKIVMVSSACNTALSLSPSDILPNVPLLNNLSNVRNQVKISTNSLITSIQDAVVKQSLPKIVVNSKSNEGTKESLQHHGEDKIIMHLRKDRIRGPKRSIAIQTDFQAAFPTLPLPESFRKSIKQNARKSRRNYRKREASNASSSQSGSNSQSDDDDDDDDDRDRDNVKCDNEYVSSTKQNNYRNNCFAPSSSATEYQNSEAAISVGGYSSRSSRRHRSSVSSSYSESGRQRKSRSRKRKTSYRKSSTRKHSRNSSFSSSSSEYSADRSRSRSRSRNCYRSRSPYYHDSKSRHEENYLYDRNVSKSDVEERRIVYVGQIEDATTKEKLRRKFIVYGPIKQISIHFKDTGMKYGFVTFERAQDAFAVIDNSTKDSQISMYDISFGGRRAFCRTSYADLDNAGINTYHSIVFPNASIPKKPEDSFEELLQKVKAKMEANKASNHNKT